MNIFKRLFRRRRPKPTKPTKAERITRIYSASIVMTKFLNFILRAHVRLATGENATVMLTDKNGRRTWKTHAEAAEVLAWTEREMAAREERLHRPSFLGRLACAMGLHLYRHRKNGGHPERICERCGKAEKRFFFGFLSRHLLMKGPAKKKAVSLWCEKNPRRTR